MRRSAYARTDASTTSPGTAKTSVGVARKDRAVSAGELDDPGHGVDRGADPHVRGAVGVDVVAEDERAAEPADPAGGGGQLVHQVDARPLGEWRGPGVAGTSRRPAAARVSSRSRVHRSGRARSTAATVAPQRSSDRSGPISAAAPRTTTVRPSSRSQSGLSMTASTASRRVGSTTPAATHASSRRRRSSPRGEPRGRGCSARSRRRPDHRAPRWSGGRPGSPPPRRARRRGGSRGRRGSASASGREPTPSPPRRWRRHPRGGPGRPRRGGGSGRGSRCASSSRAARRRPDQVDGAQGVGHHRPAGRARRAPPVDLGEDDAGEGGGLGRHAQPHTSARGVGHERRDVGEVTAAELAVDEPVVEAQGQGRDPARLDGLGAVGAGDDPRPSRTVPNAMIADSPGLMIGVPASTPKTPTLVIVIVPPDMSAGWVRPSRAVASARRSPRRARASSCGRRP